MRIRFKPWAREELETSPFYINEPKEYKNRCIFGWIIGENAYG